MVRRWVAAIGWVLAGLSATAAPLLVNGNFAQARENEATLPAVWSVPADSGWLYTNEDGTGDQFSLRYSVRAQAAGKPVTQTIVLTANTEYVLKAALKTDGQLRPLVRVLAAGQGGQELARVVVGEKATAAAWQGYSATFAAGAVTQAVVEIWADGRHATGAAAPAGSAGMDDVQVLTTAEQAALTPTNPATGHENVARGCPYTVDPNPSYGYCTDANDKIQLTDGEYTAGYFWTQKSTVGWTHARPVVITLDLGTDLPVRGLSFNTAGGVARVEFPTSIMALISVDGRAYHALGDLVALGRKHGVPPMGKYGVHRFITDDLQSHGRYLKLLIDPAGAYCFADEIEVFRGAPEWTQLALTGPEIRYPLEYFQDNLFNAALKRRIGYDLEAARTFVLGAGLDQALVARLQQEIAAIEKGIGELPEQNPGGFQSVIPLNDLHARVYALYGSVRSAKGGPALTVWAANPWDFLQPAELPEQPPTAAVTIAAMRGENRAGALNLTNGTDKPFRVKLTFAGLPGGQPPADITVHDVPWTDTYEGTPIAAALPALAAVGEGYEVSIPAGMTKQVYFTFKPVQTPAGTHKGTLHVAAAGTAPLPVPFTLRVFDLTFPAAPTLHVGGWDYTDTDAQYGVTPDNREALIAHLRERSVDSPRVASWIHFWVDFVRRQGLQPEQLVLLLLDEPNRPEQDEIIVAWAKVIQAAEPAVVIWEDPTYRKPEEALPEMMAVADVLCPNRPMLLEGGKPFADFYRAQKAAGRRLDFYSCSGPAFLLDPYSYHRLQAWTCFAFGAESSYFWAFADTGGGDPWNAYTAKRTAYAPAFVAPQSVTAGKHMEAIRESVGDFEYLVLLQQRIAAVEKAAPQDARLAAAKALLAAAPGRVLDAERASMLGWREAKDRSLADTVRIEVGELLERLQ